MGHLDIIGFQVGQYRKRTDMQEVYKSQLLDLSALLGPRFGNVGVGRDDGKEAGEYSPIFYDKCVFKRTRSSQGSLRAGQLEDYLVVH